jgi:hypothetical protein
LDSVPTQNINGGGRYLTGAVMGYNRSGTRRTKRLKRHKKHVKRLLAKAEAAAKTSK